MQSDKIHPKFNRTFINKSIEQTLNFLEETLKGQNKVINFKQPEQLKQAIDFDIKDEPCPEDELLKACTSILDYQVKPYHPHFHNKLFGGFDQYSYVGAVMAPSINGNLYTYEIAPCFTLMEATVYEHMRKIIGWQKIDATMTPGGSFANFMGIHLSRVWLHPDFNKKGLYGCKPMKIFTSQVSHYSMKKGANLCGIGSDNLVSIKTDQNRRMIPAELEKAILEEKEKGNDCLMVNSTAGTTVEGNFDPITQIGEICKKYKIWHHVDGAFGGAFIMSEKLIKKIGSFQNVDSIAFDPHKALVVPLQATLFMCKYPDLMLSCNSANADYLFHKERASYDGSLDVGDKTLQCGRVIDIMKLWTYFKGNGWKQIAEQVQNEHKLALYVKDYVIGHPDRYEMVVPEVDTFNVCFWYKPIDMDRKNYKTEEEYLQFLSKVTVLAKKYMIDQGKLLVGYSSSKSPHYFWRTVTSNPYNTNEDMDFKMKLIGDYCEQAFKELTK